MVLDVTVVAYPFGPVTETLPVTPAGTVTTMARLPVFGAVDPPEPHAAVRTVTAAPQSARTAVTRIFPHDMKLLLGRSVIGQRLSAGSGVSIAGSGVAESPANAPL
jgi:hypothetical protein